MLFRSLFAEATGDHQWIHVDPERAKDSPFGGTIAHGYLSVSLLAPISQSLLAKVGFRQEGVALRYLQINGEWRDHVLFALLADEAQVS